MKRLLLENLLKWKARKARKPLLIDGARQTGKTYLLKRLLGDTFPNVVRLDFLERPELAEAFTESISPKDILTNIELLTGQPFNPETDLLILDEIGECQRAVTSLKYFSEQNPTYFIAASGSNIGLLQSFPVGKVEQYILRPLSFREFLWASQEQPLIDAFEKQVNSDIAHRKLLDKLTDYYFTGGLPEVVDTWFKLAETSILDRINQVTLIQNNLLQGYTRDFGKYAGKVDATLIESVFNSIPSQLANTRDQSVKRFKFREILNKKSRYADFESAITWLHRCRLTLKNYIIEGTPRSPLAAYAKDNKIKLFFFDTGLLNHALGSQYQEIKQQNYEYKGYIAENFVQQEFAALGLEPSFSWQDARAELEFIMTNEVGNVIPIEVKSGTRTRAKSLASYVKKCSPMKTIKLTGTRGSPAAQTTNIVMPIYYTQWIPGFGLDQTRT